MKTIYGVLNGEFVELGKPKNRFHAWLIARKYKRSDFDYILMVEESFLGTILKIYE